MQSDKWGCREIAAGLASYGICDVITSPGSRNSPLIMAVARHHELNVRSVIDERSAAFHAIGMSEASGKPTALICTSGTALLNYAPAVAEAYYKQIPLIVISADRPQAWIDQNDSQTMHQPNALLPYVKRSFAFKGEADNAEEQWFVNRTINEALTLAATSPQGPIHINIALSEPLTCEVNLPVNQFRHITSTEPNPEPTSEALQQLVDKAAGQQLLIVAGYCRPHQAISDAISQLTQLPNVAVVAEGLANLHDKNVISLTDRLVTAINHDETLKPKIVLTFGGALVTGTFKRYMRTHPEIEQWYVGCHGNIVDCYMNLTQRINLEPQHFLPNFIKGLEAHQQGATGNAMQFNSLWQQAALKVYSETDSAIENAEWNALTAVHHLLKAMPAQWNLQLSNGMSVRYALTADLQKFSRIECNRGVSGIDGSVSTAVGAAMQMPTLLITGDMSMQYDIAALSSLYIDGKLRIAVINNGGGGIFRYISTTSSLPETPQLINGQLRLPLKQLAEAYNCQYVAAHNYAELAQAMEVVANSKQSNAVILEIITDSDIDAKIMHNYNNYKHSN